MKVFIVTQWNGLDYDESESYNCGVLPSLEDAREYCDKNIPRSSYYNEQLNPAEAYNIEEWDGIEKVSNHPLDKKEE